MHRRRGVVALALEPDLSVGAWLELADLHLAVLDDGRGRQPVVPGPLARDTERCDDPACVSARILEWVLLWRAGIR